VLGYGLFEARRLIEGPIITLQNPQNGAALAGSLIHISGRAQNVAFFSINGAQAFVDQNGNFDEALAPAPGYTVITVSGRDRFGRVSTKTAYISVVRYCPATV